MGAYAFVILFCLMIAAFRAMVRRAMGASELPPPRRDMAGHPMGQLLQGMGEVLPLGIQSGWNLGPPPPLATVDEDGAHTVAMSKEELAALRPYVPMKSETLSS